MQERVLSSHQRIAFAGELRAARAAALRDAESFAEIAFVLERLGSFRRNAALGLGDYQGTLGRLAKESPLAEAAAARCPELHSRFHVLYEEVRIGRNDAMHQGVAARHLSRHAQELAVILEDALMSKAKKASDFMVRDPVCAELWHPLSAIRRTMLLNSFSFLPYQTADEKWRIVSDRSLVRFLRDVPTASERNRRLLMSLEEAQTKGLESLEPQRCKPDDPIGSVASALDDVPCLVLSKSGRLLGIITAFDLL